MNNDPEPGSICETCGHFAMRHNEHGCGGVDPAKGCRFGGRSMTNPNKACPVFRWMDLDWPKPWIPSGGW